MSGMGGMYGMGSLYGGIVQGSGAGTQNSLYSNYGNSQALGTQSQRSQYQIPGAQPWYNQMSQGLGGAYTAVGNNLTNQWGGLDQTVMSGMGNIFGAAMGGANALGADELKQLKDFYDQTWGQDQQSLQNRGLSNTTVQDSMRQGLAESEARQVPLTMEDIYKQKLNVLGQFGSPIPQEQAALGQAGLAAQQNLNQQGLGAQQALGQQLGGLVGQQGIQSSTGTNAQATSQTGGGAQANNWQQQSAQASQPNQPQPAQPGFGSYGGPPSGGGTGGGLGPPPGAPTSTTFDPNYQSIGPSGAGGGGISNPGTTSGGGTNSGGPTLGGGGINNPGSSSGAGGSSSFPPDYPGGTGTPPMGGGGITSMNPPDQGNGAPNAPAEQFPTGGGAGMYGEPNPGAIPTKPGYRPQGGGFSGYGPGQANGMSGKRDAPGQQRLGDAPSVGTPPAFGGGSASAGGPNFGGRSPVASASNRSGAPTPQPGIYGGGGMRLPAQQLSTGQPGGAGPSMGRQPATSQPGIYGAAMGGGGNHGSANALAYGWAHPYSGANPSLGMGSMPTDPAALAAYQRGQGNPANNLGYLTPAYWGAYASRPGYK